MRAVPSVILVALLIAASASGEARPRHTGGSGRVPDLDVKGSCRDAQKFSAGDNKNMAFKGCMRDETQAKSDLAKRWSSFRAKDRSDCVEQSRAPSPSYVEVLTCLEMNTDAIRSAPRANGRPVPQLGGPVAPSLSNETVPKT